MSVRIISRRNHAFLRPSAAARRATRLAAAALGALLLVVAAPATALAVSTLDLIALSKAGLGDEVLVALIEADGTVFHLDGPKILELRAAGVSERVITAMLRNASRGAEGPSAPHATDASAPAVVPPEQFGPPYFVVIGEKPAEPAPVSAPVYGMPWMPWVGVPVRAARHAPPTIEYRGFGRFINDGWIDSTHPGRFMNNGWVDNKHR